MPVASGSRAAVAKMLEILRSAPVTAVYVDTPIPLEGTRRQLACAYRVDLPDWDAVERAAAEFAPPMSQESAEERMYFEQRFAIGWDRFD